MIKPTQQVLCLSRLVGGSRLWEADLSWADLEYADLRGADLVWADIEGASLEGADLTEAHLEEADLTEAHLSGANLTGAINFDKFATPTVCALAKVGAPWECISWEWGGRRWDKPEEYDHWVGIAKLYVLGQESGEEDV